MDGGDRMARILAGKANGELGKYTKRWQVKCDKIDEIGRTKTERKYGVEDIEK